jgi:hypothetical protein
MLLCTADEVYIRDEKLREEYVLCEEGLMWRGSHSRQKKVMWTFGQFQKNMLEISFLLLLKIRRLALIHCSDPVKVSRNLSAAVSQNSKWSSSMREKLSSCSCVIRLYDINNINAPVIKCIYCWLRCRSRPVTANCHILSDPL